MSHRIFERETYEKVYQPGLMRLKDLLEEWNEKANAKSPPYEDEVEWLTHNIGYAKENWLDKGATTIRDVFSVKSERLMRAAAMLSVHEKEQDITEKRGQKYPARVIAAMETDLEWMRSKADLMKDVEPADVLWDVIPNPKPTAEKKKITTDSDTRWDVFISHATEDKPFVRELAEALAVSGLQVWYDQFTLKVGDSLRRSIDNGLNRSRFGVVVLSHFFFAKEWPQRELDGLAARENRGQKIILPVWHNIDADEVRNYSPTLADRVAVKSSSRLESVVAQLLNAIGGPPS